MKKETITAIILGILLGGVLAVIIIFKNRESQFLKNKSISPKETTPTAANNVTLSSLTITEPKDGVIVNKASVTIKASVPRDSLVVIQSPIKDLVFNSTKDQFSVDFPLSFGENDIRVAVYPKNTQIRPKEKELRVYYLTDEL